MKKVIRNLLIIAIFVTIGAYVGIKIASNNELKKSILIAEKYLEQERYDDAIKKYEEIVMIKEDYSEGKERIELIKKYIEIKSLYEDGNYFEIKNRLDEIKKCKGYEIVKPKIEKLEEVIYNNSNDVGCSLRSLDSFGHITYKNGYLYYLNVLDNDKLYKKNIKTGKIEKLSDDKPRSINIYGDYAFYLAEKEIAEFYKTFEIKSVKLNGTDEKTIVNGDENCGLYIQVVGDYLYYECNEKHTEDTYISSDIVALNLKTMEKRKIITTKAEDWVVNRNSDSTVDIYIINREYVGKVKDVENNTNGDIIKYKENLDGTYLIGVNGSLLYYYIHNIDQIYSEKTTAPKGLVVTNMVDGTTSLIYEDYNYTDGFLHVLADNGVYSVTEDKTLGFIDFVDGKYKRIKEIDIDFGRTLGVGLFDVGGYLGYINEEERIYIDSNISLYNNDNMQ